ncbi:MAG TPA: class I SAM-dependent methyltransferase [Terriglobia bacterium]|nr:class I SAM-dependent methyltransferase [Terriglobia bacterium]
MQLDEYRKMYALEENFWWYRGMLRITKQILQRHFQPGGDIRILDAGCGTGKMLVELEGYALKHPVGFDFSAEAVKFLKLRGVANVLQASTTDIPFKSESFDLVTSFDVLCQLPGEGDRRALQEFHRVLKPGGMIYVRLPANPWLFATHDRCSLTVRRYDRSDLVAKVEQAGFRILKASYANFFLFPVFAFKRLVLERFGIFSDSSDLRPVPAVLNRILEIPLTIESRFLAFSSVRFPCGVSLVCFAQKQ